MYLLPSHPIHRWFAPLTMTSLCDFVKTLRIVVLLAVSLSAVAQEPASPHLPAFTPRFPLPTSGLEWRENVTPAKYWDATGRRAAAFGRQDGKFEAWVWPIKVVHGFRLEFRQDGMPEPVRGEEWLREVITRPESTTLVYVHPKFVVREIVWAPLNSPALVVMFDVDSAKPLNITAKFVPDFKPMWPASLGGQHSWWIAEEKAFGLGDAQEKHVALIGSPAVASYTDFMDHSLIGGEMLLGIRLDAEQSKTSFAAMVISLGMSGEKEARANYENAIAHLRDNYETKTADWKNVLENTTQIETPDPILNRAWQWGKVAIHSGWVCTPVPGNEGVGEGDRAGCGMIAGYGPAGDGERPAFAWWFGGDGLMATWAMEDYGDMAGALQELRFLKSRQREDGKITHEIVQSLDLVDWFKDFHFAYMHADTTPMYIYSVAEYYRRTGDRKFLDEFWPSVKKAYDWCVSVTDPKDGLMDNTKAGLGAIEVGVLRGKVTKDIYLEGFWVGALQGMRDITAAMNDSAVRQDATERSTKALDSLQNQWWDPEQKYFAFGVTADGQRAMMPGNWPSVLMAYAPRSFADKADLQMERFSQPDLASDWGTRTISNLTALFDPVSYNNGTVWPMIETWTTWAQYRWGLPPQAFASLHDTANVTGLQSPGYMPEHMNGTYFESGERSVPHQLFSTIGFVVPTIRGMFGLETRVIGNSTTLWLQPVMPADWIRAAFTNYHIPDGELGGEFQRSPGRISLKLELHGNKSIQVFGFPRAPLGAKVKALLENGKDVSHRVLDNAATLRDHLLVETVFEGGIDIVPPVASPNPGDQSSALKVIHAAEAGPNTVDIQVAGLGGRSYSLNLVTTVPKLTADAATVSKTDDGYRLEISFEGTGYVTRDIKVRW